MTTISMPHSTTANNPILMFTLRDLINTTQELTTLLRHELELLRAMKIRDIAQFQGKKARLISSLEIMKDTLMGNPALKEQFDKVEMEEFQGVSEAFETVMLEHFRRMNVARTVNGRIVEAIRDSVMEQTSNHSYGQSGENRNHAGNVALSINETI